MKNKLFLVFALSLLLSGCTFLKQPAQNNAQTTGGKPAQQTSSNKLDLSNQQLRKVPDYVFNMTNLEELNIANNQIGGALQAEVGHLKNLKVLNMSNNLMTGVPAEIGQLQNLQILDLSNNKLTGLPYELGNLKKLRTLNIAGNSYSTIDLSIIQKKLPTSVNIIIK